MIINGTGLLRRKPMKHMMDKKIRYNGVSYGLSEAGYDIRLKQNITFQSGHAGERRILMSEPSNTGDRSLKSLPTQSGRFTKASAIEEFQMPYDLVGIVHDKSTFAREGLSVFNTVIEPGWNGFLTLELVYHGNGSLHIKAGTGIAQVVFHLLGEQGDYGDGKYQGQPDAPIPAIYTS